MERKAKRNDLREANRQKKLHKQFILHTLPEDTFDIFAHMAMAMLDTSSAGIGFVDGKKIWFKSTFGIERQLLTDVSLCEHAFNSHQGALVVEDVMQDERFSASQFVGGEHGLRFYARAMFTAGDGAIVGMICVTDPKPHLVDRAFIADLNRIAKAVGIAVSMHELAAEAQERDKTDELTGLHKSQVFIENAKTLIGQGDVTLLLADIEGMREINGLLGRTVGDSILEEAGRRMSVWARSYKAVCGRLGGDELVAAVPGPNSPRRSKKMAESLARALNAAFLPLDRVDTMHFVAGVGIATSTKPDTDVEDMVRSAEASLVLARNDGSYVGKIKNGLPSPGGKREATAMLKEAFLLKGVKPFKMDYQPIFNLHDGSLHSFEALVRWHSKDGRIWPPSYFIPIAEADGNIVHLDAWCLHKACEDAASWESDISVSVNISAASFLSGSIENKIKEALERTGLAPGRLKIEITETALLPGRKRTRQAMAAIQSMGVKILLDDFGCGHASFAYLRDYSFDGIKIDKVFIQGAEDGGKARALLHTLSELASFIGIETVVEGIETELQLEVVRSEGIKVVQGYLMGRPQAYEAAAKLAARWKAVEVP